MTTLISDDFTPRYCGDVTPLQHQFVDHNNDVFPLNGLDLSEFVIKFKNVNTGKVKTGAGSWQFVNGGDDTNGIAWYQWDPTDVADTGLWAMQTTVPFTTGPQHFDIKVIEFIAPL